MRAETLADFCEFYALDLPLDGGGWAEATDADIKRWSVLFSQLPARSRCARRLDPDALWDDTARLLHQLEFDVRNGFWMFSKDAPKRRNKPRPIQTPGERASKQRSADSALKAKADISAMYGIEC